MSAVAVQASWRVGDVLPELVHGPITRGTLALFAGASNDHVLLHIDSDFARAAGMDDVFAHGMLSMAYLGQLLTGHFPANSLREWSVRFVAITPLYATVHCFARVVEIFAGDSGERLARLEIGARTGNGLPTLAGHAIVALE
jgi:acyl dehydratase